MKLSVPYFEVCRVPASLTDCLLVAIDEGDWYVSDYRRSVARMPATNSIPIHHTPLCASGDPTDRAIRSIRKEPLYDKYAPLLEPILTHLQEHYEFNQYAAFLARLHPQSQIHMHRDRGQFLEKCHRVHIPLQTNPKVAYCIGVAEYFWPVGKAYEFDNTRLHGVKNRSYEARIHLVINLYNLTPEQDE